MKLFYCLYLSSLTILYTPLPPALVRSHTHSLTHTPGTVYSKHQSHTHFLPQLQKLFGVEGLAQGHSGRV